MANRWSDNQAVREYMKAHPEVVEKVTRRRDELARLSIERLVECAEGLGVDTLKIRERLAAQIIAAESSSHEV